MLTQGHPPIVSISPAEEPAKAASLADSLRPPGPIQLELFEEVQDTRIVIRAVGEVDVMTAPKLSARLDGILRGQTTDVVIDLREASFLDSAGLVVLLNAARRLTRRSRRLEVVCGAGPVRHVIELARLGETLNLVDPDS
jgi:anti-sigma B factor antagonist